MLMRAAEFFIYTLSLIPPTCKTRPRRVNSPVIAVSDLTLLWLKRETNAVTKVTPAEGPSLGTAPAGKCIWTSLASSRFTSSPADKFSSAALALTYLFVLSHIMHENNIVCIYNRNYNWERLLLTHVSAICADSLITSPSCPVRCRSPFPTIAVASTNCTSPPNVVQGG